MRRTSVVIGKPEGERLLETLDGLPLAIAQAGAYLQSGGLGIGKYLEYYGNCWNELWTSRDWGGDLMKAYPSRTVATTWTISYDTI